MGKTLALSLGGLGAGGAGIGGLLALKPWESEETFATKYKHALLDTSKDSDSWKSKYEELKTKDPAHPTLKKAATEAKKNPSSNEVAAKQLLREGCKAIYESPYGDSKYKDDFKKYCSRNNKDASSGDAWNTDTTENNSGNKWDASLTSLKGHDTSKNGDLVDVLSQLKEEIKSKNSTFEKTYREKLKNWCESVQKEPFMGSDSLEFKNQELYCKGK
ncbi:hypothetical protein MHF_0377 [Mycoplasma haemofelis Ohio2]|uniref:Uncharacterized protein n=1 Tax=Mycoplasma haemofelis (strain Ohio2) TaxID=859194 RepID=F6FH48_MYCHI|nr:hypothetical protein MHF_0377 [Mycoplasma haemofelis Ohio2]